jgi:hypothetical protein
MKAAIALLVAIVCLDSAFAGQGCPVGPASNNILDAMAEGGSPALHEQRQRERAERATYEALLAAGAPDKLACAAALNPDLLRMIAPTYFGRPSR